MQRSGKLGLSPPARADRRRNAFLAVALVLPTLSRDLGGSVTADTDLPHAACKRPETSKPAARDSRGSTTHHILKFQVAITLIGQVASALRTLNPEQVRSMVRRPVTFGVLAADECCVEEIHDFLFPRPYGCASRNTLRIATEDDFARVTVGFSERGVPHPAHFYAFDRIDPRASASTLLREHEDAWLPLASNFPGFRRSVSELLTWKIAKENTLFTVATALPNIVPSVLTLPWSVGEYASDSAFLTLNQVRLSFLLAAAHGQEVGYDRQSLKIGSIIGAAVGWRALARQLVSKIPAGGGLLSKGLIAFAGTYAVGRGLEHWYREGTLLGSAAQREHYANALRRGRETVQDIVDRAMSNTRAVVRSA